MTQTPAPAATNPSAIARPMPRVPPVTSAAFPSSRNVFAGSITGRSQVQARLTLVPARRHRVYVPLAQDQVVLAADVDLEAGVGREQDEVTLFHVAHRRPHRDDLRPVEPPVLRRGRRDHDPGPALPLAHLLRRQREDAVGGHADRLLDVVGRFTVGSHAPPRLSAAGVVPEEQQAAASLTTRTVVAGDSWLTPS